GVTGANRPDDSVFAPLVASIAPIKRPRGRPDKLHGDKGDDYRHCRRYLRRRGIKGRLARQGVERTTRLGRHRWVAERTLAWLHRFRRLTIRYERAGERPQAFLDLGCALVCLNF